MVQNKTLQTKNKAPTRTAAPSSKKPAKATKQSAKTSKLSAKAASNGHSDPEMSRKAIEMSSSENVEVDTAESVEVAVNSEQQNMNDATSGETIETVNKDEGRPTLPLSKTKGRQKKGKDNKMETKEEVQPATNSQESDNSSEPIQQTGKSRKRKAGKDVEDKDTEQTVPGETEPEAVAGPSRSRKRKVETASEDISTKKSAKEKKSVPVPKTKAKRQKVVLKVPPAKSVSGKVFVMGENDVGQLGLTGVEVKKRPAMLDLPYSFDDIAAGGMHSVCLTDRGEVITFGCNDEGALGRITSGDDSLESKPLTVEIFEKVVQISAGDSHSAALTESGQVYLWGNFRSGDGPMGLTVDGAKQATPIRILNDVTVVKISSGTEHLACLSDDGLIYTLGCGANGQLGRLTERNAQNGGRTGLAALLNPGVVHVNMGLKQVPIEDVWTGSYNTFLKAQETGKIYAFGLNNYHQLGLERKNDGDNFRFTPKHVASFSDNTWLHITGGQHHSLALDKEGLVYALGRSDYGRLGLGENCEEKSVPTVIPTLENDKCTAISCGNCVSFAVTEEGSVYSWGMGDNHQLGHGKDEDCHVPERIEGNFLNSWKAHKVSGGGQHTLILAIPKENPKSDKKK